MQLIDAHCHFDFPQFDGRREAELEQARSLGLRRLVIPGVRRPDWDSVRDTALAHNGLFYCLGIHPWFVDEHSEEDLTELRRRLAARPERCVALGECGLDRLKGSLEVQWPWFDSQVALANEFGMPLVIHSVKAHDEVHSLLNRRQWTGRALIHGFSGSFQQGEKLVDLEDYFRRWRFNHVTTVERVIGFKRGTGSTSGVQYLRKMLSVELFPELWQVRGEL